MKMKKAREQLKQNELNRKWKISRSEEECAEAEMTLQGADKKSKVRRITHTCMVHRSSVVRKTKKNMNMNK